MHYDGSRSSWSNCTTSPTCNIPVQRIVPDTETQLARCWATARSIRASRCAVSGSRLSMIGCWREKGLFSGAAQGVPIARFGHAAAAHQIVEADAHGCACRDVQPLPHIVHMCEMSFYLCVVVWFRHASCISCICQKRHLNIRLGVGFYGYTIASISIG